MSKNNKDLTSIEDLGEYIHELNNSEDEEVLSVDALDNELPDFSEGSDDSFSFSSDAETETEIETTEEPTEDFSFESSSDFETPEVDEPLFEESESASESEPYNFESPLEEAPAFTTPYTPEANFKTPETFEEVKKFAESSSFTGMGMEGNPSFSVLIKNVKFIEDVSDIIILLKELDLLSDSEEQVKTRLMRGHLLVPRISEYAAIYLSHKLRRFDIEILVGLSDEIHPPKHHETPETGMVSKANLYQNQNHHFEFNDAKVNLSEIIIAATPSLEGYQVVRYLGVASEHKMIDGRLIEDESSHELPHHYQDLAQKLRAHAVKAHSNAVVGLNYQLTPLPSEFGIASQKYRLTCTGNLVWVNKL